VSEKLKNNAKVEEYLFLREEIMSRISWRRECSKRATVISLSIWGGCFLLVPKFFGEEFVDKPVFTLLLPLLMLLPIVIMYAMSNRQKINDFGIAQITSYLKKFHEKPIYENDGTFFSWETSISAFYENFKKSNPQFRKDIRSHHSDELHFLPYISLALFVIFSLLGLWNLMRSLGNFNCCVMLIGIVVVIIVSVIMSLWIKTFSQHDYVKKMVKDAKKIWDEHSEKIVVNRI
jgi:hypothetical protein